jgi:hypothetical protein
VGRTIWLVVLVALAACGDTARSLAIDAPSAVDAGVDAATTAAVDAPALHHEGESCDDGAGCDPGLVCKAVGDPCPTYPRCSVCYVPCGDAGTCPPGYRTCIPPTGQGGDVCIH